MQEQSTGSPVAHLKMAWKNVLRHESAYTDTEGVRTCLMRTLHLQGEGEQAAPKIEKQSVADDNLFVAGKPQMNECTGNTGPGALISLSDDSPAFAF